LDYLSFCFYPVNPVYPCLNLSLEILTIIFGSRIDGRPQADDDRFRRGRVALFGDASDGYEHVGFGEVGRCTASRDAVGNNHERICRALFTLEVTDEINELPLNETLLFHV